MKYPQLILILLSFLLFACDEEQEKEKETTPHNDKKELFQIISQEWQLSEMSFDEIPVPTEKYEGAYYRFYADSTYRIFYPTYQDTGKWELGSDQKSILFLSQTDENHELHPHSIVHINSKELELIRYESEPIFDFDEGMKTLKLQAK